MADDSASCELIRLHSNPMPKEWDACPETTDFKMKVRNQFGKFATFMYTVKEGIPLPYNPQFAGL